MACKQTGTRPRAVLLVLVLTVSLLAALSSLFTAPPAHAAAPDCGTVQVAAADWLGGAGVDVRSNGSMQNSETECRPGGEVYNLAANPPQFGYGWQCVELVNRLYSTKGWYSKLTLGADTNSGAKYLYTYAAAGKYPGLVAHANGSGYKPVPGDMVVHSNGTYGHVAVVSSISGNVLTSVEQNASESGKNSYAYNPTNGAVSRTGATVSGYIHAEQNTNTGGSTNTVSVSAVSSYLMSNGIQNVYTGNGAGSVYHISWGGGTQYSQWKIADLGSKITSVSSFVSGGGVHNVYIGTQAGRIHHISWGNGAPLTVWQIAALGSPVTSVSAQVGGNGVQHVYSSTAAGTVHETAFGNGTALSTWQVGTF